MAEESVSILKVDTAEAVKNVNDLKENIKLLKERLGELTIGEKEYQDTLNELKVNQNALKDAMYGTSASMEDIAASAKGLNVLFDENNKLINKGNQSYNALVHTMAELKQEWRATSDEARRAELGEQIAQINTELKDMDASVGNFSRNVGNYTSGVAPLVAKFDEWGGFLKQMPPTLGAAKESIGKVGESMQLIGKQPILGIIGLLAPIIIKITDSLKDNQTAMDAVKKLMSALQPVFDVFSGVLEKVAQGLSKMVDWVIELAGKGALDGFISKVAGVGNAILQYLLAPIKSAIAGFKGVAAIIKDVFTGDFKAIKGHAKEAGEGIAEAWKEGFSFKANFKAGEEKGAEFIKGVRANRAVAKSAGEEIGKEMAKGVEDGLKLADVGKALAKGDSVLKAKFDAEKTALKEIDDWWTQEMASVDEDINALFEENIERLKENTRQKSRLTAEEIIAGTMAVADATSGLMSTLADMYESDEKNAEKNAKKIKGLRIASATIDMLNGAVAAFASAQQLPPPFGQIVGAANAAAVIAMGVANINKIKSTNFSSGGSVSAAPAAVSAPNVETQLPTTRNLTSASEEERLNRMASNQRVYILQSDIEAAGTQSKAQVAESSF